ncbi:MAG: DUF814 domain-containing protein [Calditrichaeota bacterium]|nr:MAG: DUF814 domain-containing protein [Calditrichota bacterium]
MHKNYYLFNRQVDDLYPVVTGSTIRFCHTEKKNELVIGLDKGIVRISIAADLPYLFFEENGRPARANHFEQFPLCIGQSITNVRIVACNKHVIFETGQFNLHVVFYGKQQNIYFTDKEERIIDRFKQKQPELELLSINEDSPMLSADCCSELKEDMSGATLSAFIRTVCPAFNKLMQQEALCRLHQEAHTLIRDLTGPNAPEQVLHALNDSCRNGSAFVYRKENDYRITLFKSAWLEKQGYEAAEYENVNKAWMVFISRTIHARRFYTVRNRILKALEKRREQLTKALNKLAEAEDIERRKQLADLKGHLLLTHKHKVPRGVKEVTLVNLFSEKQEKITIKLNPQKTTVENAQYYFNKYKNSAKKKEALTLKRATYTRQLQEIDTLLERARQYHKVDNLEKIHQQLVAMHLIQEHTPSARISEKAMLKFAFKRVILDNRWDVYIGKNDQNNDMLTFQFANKWDIWMHAQGVPGSHVVIKKQKKEEIVPKSVIEKAARLAAANSKNRHASTVPVVFTEARYVNRIRKAPAGTVAIKNEKVLFVEPLNLN